MKFGVIGAGGRLGGKIAAAALDRDIGVTAIVRKTPCRDRRAAVLQKSLFDLTAEDAAQFGVLISAFGGGFTADPSVNRHAVEHLAAITRGTGIHLILTGGAGCLYAGESREKLVYETPGHPAFLKGISRNLALAFEGLCLDPAVNWTFVCPSLLLDPDGPRTGDYLTRCDRHILYNEDGHSYVSYDDLAGAMADFGEQGLFQRQLVTVASRRGGPQEHSSQQTKEGRTGQ